MYTEIAVGKRDFERVGDFPLMNITFSSHKVVALKIEVSSSQFWQKHGDSVKGWLMSGSLATTLHEKESDYLRLNQDAVRDEARAEAPT